MKEFHSEIRLDSGDSKLGQWVQFDEGPATSSQQEGTARNFLLPRRGNTLFRAFPKDEDSCMSVSMEPQVPHLEWFGACFKLTSGSNHTLRET